MRSFLLVLLSAPALAQPAFDAASVKPSAVYNLKEAFKPPVFSQGGVTMRDVLVKTVVAAAYDVKDYQIVGAALPSDRYDIQAKAASATDADQLRLMLQNLLAERFKLACHRESRELPVYALVVKKESKLTEGQHQGPPAVRFEAGQLVFRDAPIPKLVEFLSRFPALGRPVLDMSGLQGTFDFTLDVGDYDPSDLVKTKRAAEQAFQDPANIAAMVEHLGLKLEPRKAPVEVIVVDHVERPTEN